MDLEKKRLIALRKIIAFSLTLRLTLISMGFSLGATLIKDKENLDTKGPVKISECIAKSIYSDEDLPITPDVHYMDLEVFKNPLEPDLIEFDDLQKIDLALNKESFKKVSKLTIDASNVDLEDLLLFPNLEVLTITNPEVLSEYDKNFINSLESLTTINFQFNYSIINDKKIDTSWVKDSLNIGWQYNPNARHNDMTDLYLYRMYKSLDPITRSKTTLYFHEDRLKELYRWDLELESIIKSFDFDENTTDEEKIQKIIKYVSDRLDYDPDIHVASTFNLDLSNHEKAREYNAHLLGSVFESDQDYGICCNYAALSSILGEYLDLDLKYISGTYGDGLNNGHMWCTFKKDGKTFIIDPTGIDSMIRNGKDLTEKEILERCLFIEETSPTYREYSPYNVKNDEVTEKQITEHENIFVPVYEYKVRHKMIEKGLIGSIFMFLLLYADIVIRYGDMDEEKEQEKKEEPKILKPGPYQNTKR